MAIEPQVDFDPHNLKHDGSNSPKSAHVNAPYEFQEFPKYEPPVEPEKEDEPTK